MFKLQRTQHAIEDNVAASRLFDQDTFYGAFVDDLNKAKSQVIIECPFITTRRISVLAPTLRVLARRHIKLTINTKPPEEYEADFQLQAEQGLAILQQLGATVLFTGGHHRKLAIIDDTIVWEGSLNILSQSDSCEIMRRIYSEQAVNQMLAFLHLEKFIG